MQLFINHRQDNWVDWIALAEFSYNNKIHTATQMSPFYAAHGYHPRMGFELHQTFKSESAEEFGNRMTKTHEEAQSALVCSRDKMKRFGDQRRIDAPEYKVGDLVWLSVENLDIKVPSRKLAHKRVGPFPIIEIISPNAVKLKLPAFYKIHPVINVSRLSLYHTPTKGQTAPPPPPPIVVEGEKQWEVEEILDSRMH